MSMKKKEHRVKSITELNRLSKEDFLNVEKTKLTIVLDNVRSMNNIGSIFRTSDAFLVSEIMLCGITAIPPHNEIHKTALGAEENVKFQYFNETLDACKHLQSKGFMLCALEQTTNSITLSDFEFERYDKIAIILGNEVKGVEQKVVDLCDYTIEIPQFGTKHSLNVSVAASITIWECFRKKKL